MRAAADVLIAHEGTARGEQIQEQRALPPRGGTEVEGR